MNQRGVRKLFNLLTYAIICVALFACKSSRELAVEDLEKRNSREILELVKDSAFNYEAISARVSAKMDTPERSGSFRMNMRLENDSAIWISATATLGIEVLRTIISKDSVKYIDKMKNKFFAGSINDLEEKSGLPLGYESMEKLLIGNLVDVDEVDRFKVSQDGKYYLLTAKVPRKLWKAVGLNKSEELTPSTDTSFQDVVKKRKLRKAKEKFDPDLLVLEQYWIDPDHFSVRKLLINDVSDQATLEVSYPEYQMLDGTHFPKQLILELTNNGEKNRVELEFNRIRRESRGIRMPYNIPDHYEVAE